MATELPAVQVAAAASQMQITVLDREALLAEGDGDLLALLRRQPGVSVDADGYISLRGMGSGYTQVLFNDRPLGALTGDVLLDGLSIQMIERIEIVRGAVPSDNGGGVAGTIRIYSRQAGGTPERTASVRLGFSPNGQFAHSLSLAAGGRSDQLEWQINTQIQQTERQRNSSTDLQADYGPGLASESQLRHNQNQERLRNALVAGEVAVRPSAQDRIGLRWVAELSPTHSSTHSQMDYRYAVPMWNYQQQSRSLSQQRSSNSPNWSLMPTLHWERQLAAGGRLHLQLGTEQSGGRQSYTYTEAGDYGQFTEGETYHERQRHHHLSLSLEQALTPTSGLTLGGQWRREQQEQTMREDEESVSSQLQRRTLAAYALWRWQPAPAWQLETGLRREQMQLDLPEDSQLPRRSEGLWLPSLNLRFAAAPDQHWHLGLARTYRAAKLDDLMPGIRWRGGYFQSPNLAGNPQLRNELSTGLELGVTQALHYQGRAIGQFSANWFARSIRDSQITELLPYQDEFGEDRWMLRPTNNASTRVLGLETGLRWDLSRLPADAALRLPLALRADLTLTHSRVADRPAPARLAGQTPAQLDLGLDGHSRSGGLRPENWGIALRLEAGYRAHINPSTVLQARPLTTLHLHALWKLDPGLRLRLQWSQLGPDWRSQLSQPLLDGGTQTTRMRTDRPWVAALVLEKDF